MGPTEGIRSKSQLMGLPNELFFEVASNLKSFKDLNSLVRTSRFFHGMFNRDLYRGAVAADDIILDGIVRRVLSKYRLASLALLLDNGLSVNHQVHYRCEETMLSFLCSLDDHERSVPLARLLIQRGADMKAKDPRTLLHKALLHGNFEITALLLAQGADPNEVIMTEREGTPLHIASKNNKPEMVNLLIAHGAAIDGRDKDGNTPLHFATWYAWHSQDVISVLLAHGADVGARNHTGATPLHHVARWFGSDHHELAKSLLAHGAVVNAMNNVGETPLHWAACVYQDSGLFMVKFLLENGADVNVTSKFWRCSLHNAIHHDNEGVVALLLKHGAEVGALDTRERESNYFRVASGKSIE
jgi:ankyrin repeat protein